jgi:hypothetical protein
MSGAMSHWGRPVARATDGGATYALRVGSCPWDAGARTGAPGVNREVPVWSLMAACGDPGTHRRHGPVCKPGSVPVYWRPAVMAVVGLLTWAISRIASNYIARCMLLRTKCGLRSCVDLFGVKYGVTSGSGRLCLRGVTASAPAVCARCRRKDPDQ